MKKQNKFKKGLVADIKNELKEAVKQDELKEKYHVQEKNQKVVVVEKRYLFISFGKTILSILIYLLACIGLLTLIYPELRTEFGTVLLGIWEQLKYFLPIL